MGDEHITDHDAPVWNAAIEACRDAIKDATDAIKDATDAEVWQRINGLVRPVLSAAEVSAEAARIRDVMTNAVEKHLARGRAIDALRPFVAAYEKSADPIGDSDLYDEQPRHVSVTLGDCRRAARALQALAAEIHMLTGER